MKTSTAPESTLTENEIAQRAHELWLARGSPAGDDVEIWLEAERQLNARASAPKAPSQASRKGRSTLSEKALRDSDSIDAGELQERLSEFGEAPRRSPTSLDPA